jgi:hypothetical protein
MFQGYVLPPSSALKMEAVHTYEASVYSKETTWRYIPAGSNLHTCCRENLKSHMDVFIQGTVKIIITLGV